MRNKFRICGSISVIGMLTVTPFTLAAQGQNKIAPVKDISTTQVDQQQLRQAVASRTLTWLTGSSSNNDYVSVGRLANFFGFVALRVSSGHSLSRSRVAKETLHVLDGQQRTTLISLVENQKDVFEDVHTARHNMNRALEGLLVGEDISREEFLKLGEAYGAAEAELGRVIGQTLGNVATTLSREQKTSLADIRVQHISGNAGTEKIRGIKTKLPKADKKELVNIAARLLSWTTGDETFNDFEVVGKPSQHFGFVSLRIESNHGVKRGAVANEVWALLSPKQQASLDGAAAHNIEVFKDFLDVRGKLMRTLEVALLRQTIDVEKVRDYGEDIGRLEANMTWVQAMAMLDVRNSMSETQLTALLDMRAKYTGNNYKSFPKDPFSRGRQLFAQCVLCHSETNSNGIAPSLTGIVDRKIASDLSFANYSNALQNYAAKNITWSEGLLDDFLTSPRSEVPGTYMGYDGLEQSEDRIALITYLKNRD